MSRKSWKKHWCHLTSVEEMTAEAIEYLRANEPPEGYYVGFSGGKDSIVTLELCQLAGVKHTAYYSCTRIDPPEMYKFIKKHYPDVVWLYPAVTFYDTIRAKSPPLRVQRWCCDVLKKDPGAGNPLRSRVVGIRSEESSARASRPRTVYIKKYKITHIKPIFYWLEWHVWEFIALHGLTYPDLYNEGFDRIGCVVCPFLMHKNQTAINKHKARWPGMFKAFENACEDWFTVRLAKGLRSTKKHDNFKDYMAAYYRGFE